MNEKLNSFITNIGLMCETWTVVYQKFVSQGMDAKEAMAHTQGFMTAFISASVGSSDSNNVKEK